MRNSVDTNVSYAQAKHLSQEICSCSTAAITLVKTFLKSHVTEIKLAISYQF